MSFNVLVMPGSLISLAWTSSMLMIFIIESSFTRGGACRQLVRKDFDDILNLSIVVGEWATGGFAFVTPRITAMRLSAQNGLARIRRPHTGWRKPFEKCIYLEVESLLEVLE